MITGLDETPITHFAINYNHRAFTPKAIPLFKMPMKRQYPNTLHIRAFHRCAFIGSMHKCIGMAVPCFYLYLWRYVPASAHKILTCESTIISKTPVLGIIQHLQNSRCSTNSTNKEIFMYLSERITREGLLRMVC